MWKFLDFQTFQHSSFSEFRFEFLFSANLFLVWFHWKPSSKLLAIVNLNVNLDACKVWIFESEVQNDELQLVPSLLEHMWRVEASRTVCDQSPVVDEVGECSNSEAETEFQMNQL